MRIRLLAGAFLFLSLALAFAPASAFAEDPILSGALVPTCDQASNAEVGFDGACQLCDLVKLADNLIRFAVAFSVIVATLMFAYAGFLYFTAAASEANIKKAHGIFGKVFGGLVIVLIAWLVVNLIMSTLVNEGTWGLWHEIECAEYPVGTGFVTPNNTAIGDRVGSLRSRAGQSTTGGGQCAGGGSPQLSDNLMDNPCPNCVPLNLPTSAPSCYKGDPPGNRCMVSPTLSQRVQTLQLTLNGLSTVQSITVTGAVGGRHCATCQIAGSSNVGTCIDAVTTNRAQMNDPQRVKEFLDAANSARLRAVLEFTSATARQDFLQRASAAGLPAFPLDRVIVVEHASGIHYSIYQQ